MALPRVSVQEAQLKSQLIDLAENSFVAGIRDWTAKSDYNNMARRIRNIIKICVPDSKVTIKSIYEMINKNY